MSYNQIPISELVIRANTGLDAIKKAPIVDENTGIKCLRIQDISQQKEYINWGNTKVEVRDYNKFQLKPNYILIARTGASIGVAKFISKELNAVFNNGLIRIVPNLEKVDPKFLYYNLVSYKYREHIFGVSGGTATQPNMKMRDLLRFEISLPNMRGQKSIANILSSLDDKTELNIKINKNLEELAQTLYKRWFIDFEFPNEDGEPYKSSGGEMVESELRLIPEGWRFSHLGTDELSNLLGSGIEVFEGTKKYIATADVTNSTITSFETKITYKDRPSRANISPVPNSVWFAKMKDSRKLIRVSKESKFLINSCIFSTGFAGLVCEDSLNYIWSFILSNDFDDVKNNLCNGTTMQAINNSNITKIEILIPDEKTLFKFNLLTDEMFTKIEFNEIENNKLLQIRDKLLPKLMSGEIEVPYE